MSPRPRGSGDPADPRARAVDRRASRLAEARDRGALRHHRRTARRRSRARVDDRGAAVLAGRLSRRRGRGRQRHDPARGVLPAPVAAHARRRSRLARRRTRSLAVPGSDPDGPLATALAKLEDALELPGLVVDVGEPGQLAAIRDAVAHHRRVEIEYWSAGRDELTTRRIDPEVVFFATGEWYVGAYCHRARDERMFRVDRIRSVEPTGETFEPGATGFETGDVYTPRADDTRDARARARRGLGRRGLPDRGRHRACGRFARDRPRGQ